MMKNWKVGDILQIDVEHDEVFGGCLMIVTEVKSWGAQGYFQIPANSDVKLAYYRVKYENAERVGTAIYVHDNSED